MSEHTFHVDKPSTRTWSATKVLRLASFLLVGLSFVVIHLFNVGQVGDSMEWKNGDTSISAGSHPAMIIWSTIAIALFIFLMFKEPTAVADGIPAPNAGSWPSSSISG